MNAEKILRRALRVLFDDYKALGDSGDAGNWRLEDLPAGKTALAALEDPPRPYWPDEHFTDSARMLLAKEVFEAALKTKGFESDKVGVQLAYLLGAIVQNDRKAVIWKADSLETGHILELFTKLYDEAHPIWAFITVEEADEDR